MTLRLNLRQRATSAPNTLGIPTCAHMYDVEQHQILQNYETSVFVVMTKPEEGQEFGFLP